MGLIFFSQNIITYLFLFDVGMFLRGFVNAQDFKDYNSI